MEEDADIEPGEPGHTRHRDAPNAATPQSAQPQMRKPPAQHPAPSKIAAIHRGRNAARIRSLQQYDCQYSGAFYNSTSASFRSNESALQTPARVARRATSPKPAGRTRSPKRG
jgi:hypothetical protein